MNVDAENCPVCGEPWFEHHVERKTLNAPVGGVRVEHGMLIECPRSFGHELRDGRVKRRPPTGLLLEALKNPEKP